MCLAPGVTIDSAEAGLDGITRRLDEQDPSAPRAGRQSQTGGLTSGRHQGPDSPESEACSSRILCVLMGLIMTIACMNLATMLLARGANRRKELAIRLGVGASRFRLIRQMISEGILLSLLGGVAGFALAYGLSVLNSQLPQPAGEPLAPDHRAGLARSRLRVSPSPSCAASDSAWRRPCRQRTSTWPRHSKRARRFRCLVIDVLACATWRWLPRLRGRSCCC